MSRGEIREGDIFEREETRVLVLELLEDKGEEFAEVSLFNSTGLIGNDCISTLSLYKTTFLKNIYDL